MKNHGQAVGHAVALLTILLWGATFMSTKIMLGAFSPVQILLMRFVLGLAALTIAWPHRLRLTDRRQEWVFMGAGLTGVTLYYLLENVALTYSMASNVGVIVAVAPFFTAILAHFWLKEEPLRLHFFLGFLCSMAGICIISFHGSTQLQINPLGDFLAVVAAAVWAVYSIFIRRISSYGYSTIATTRRTFFYGTLFMLPIAFFTGGQWDLSPLTQPLYLGHLLFLGVGASATCFATWAFAVKRLGAVKTSMYIYLNPVTSIVTSAIFLHEPIGAVSLVGAALIIVGLLVSEGRLLPKGFSLGFLATDPQNSK
ncbi:MAG: DMT family transporter [Eubacteriales bacterium]|jgi:drug/metabolite transporter (DMT)-like permease